MKIIRYALLSLLFLIVVSIGLTFLPSFRYLQKTFYYRGSSIEDYKIFANRKIKANKGQEWSKADNYNKPVMGEKYIQEMEKNKTVAFLVIQDGKIIWEKYWDDYNENSLSNSFSMAKSVVSMLIGIAVEEGKIKNIDDKVADYLDNFKINKTKVRIKDCLTMSSGLDFSEQYTNVFSSVTKAYFGDDLKGVIEELKPEIEPGKTWRYASGDTQILGMILEKLYNKPLAELASEKIWQKVGAKNDALWSLDKENGTEKAYCCFNSNARDFARLGQLVLNKGMWDSIQVVPAKYLEEATAPATNLKAENGDVVDFYGFQFWVGNYKESKFPCFRGVRGQYIIPIKEKNLVIVRLGHSRGNEMVHYFPKDLYTYVEGVYEMLQLK
jgi:CubicO group peptidase (beta-lactamase class C family)